jgi:tetratricopeptide (TPR) repeat protein
MIKRILVTGLLCVFGFLANAQEKQSTYDSYLNVYQRAVKFNDFSVAKGALYNMLALKPENTSLLDSLAYIYYEYRQYASAAIVSKEALQKGPNNPGMLQIAAKSFDYLGVKTESLKMYERLYTISDDPYILYEVAYKQYELNKLSESLVTADIILGKNGVDEIMVYVNNSQQEQISVPLPAVVYNLKGIVHRQQGDEQKAKEFFQKAVNKAPNYTLAKQNLDYKGE